MNSTLPRLRMLPHSQLGEDSYHSVLISGLRALAALQVAAAHLRAQFFPGLRSIDEPTLWYQALSFFTGFAHQAVLVFFLISGWLVGGSLLNKMHTPDALKLYAIDRASRLWTVLLPTFVLVLAFGILTGGVNPREIDFSPNNAYSVSAFIGNLAGLQTISVPQFGGNFPLWSLANESWYYVLFALGVMVLGAPGRRVLPVGMLILLALLLPFDIVLYFSIWLLGALFSRLRLECGTTARLGLLALAAALSVYFRLTGGNDDMTAKSYPADLLLSLAYVFFISSTVVSIGPGKPMIARLRQLAVFFSNFSFTLYVVHIPLLGMLGWLGAHLLNKQTLAPDRLPDLGIYFAMLAIVVVVSYGFYRLFEARTYQVRRWLKAWLATGPRLERRVAPVER